MRKEDLVATYDYHVDELIDVLERMRKAIAREDYEQATVWFNNAAYRWRCLNDAQEEIERRNLNMKDIDPKGLRILYENIDRSDKTDDERVKTLATITPEVFRSEYGSICEDIKECADNLADTVEDVIKPEWAKKAVTVEDAKVYFATMNEKFELLEAYHVEFLRRYGEKAEE